jgi:hypothetical protein
MPRRLKMKKISPKDYYDLSPSFGNAAGDIWSDLPTHGLVGTARSSGIVITPACDLANCKVETITYLPITTVRSFFSMRAALPEFRRAIDGQLNASTIGRLFEWPIGFVPPTMPTLEAAERLVAEKCGPGGISGKELAAAQRVQAGFRIVKQMLNPNISPVSSADMQLLFGREWLSMRHRVVTNAYRGDLHFLPSDEQPTEWSGIIDHSVALFRYPLTAPADIFEAAQNVEVLDWSAWCAQFATFSPIASSFATIRPLKRIALKPDFLSDFLTRYAGVYIRLGSPDFTSDTVERYCGEIDR